MRSLAPSPISTVVCPRYCASLIGACLHMPHVEHGQQRSSCGKSSSPVAKSTAFVSTSSAERRTRVVDVEAEPVGHHGELGARGPQVVDERPEAGVERDLGGDRTQRRLVALDQRPLVEHALPAADLAALVLLVERPPPVGAPTRSSRWMPTSRC